MKTSTLIAVIVALIVIVGGWYWYANYYQTPIAASPSTNTTTNTNPNGADTNPNGAMGSTDTSGSSSVNADVNAGVTTGGAPTSVTVTLTSSGFSPSNVTVKKGGTVTFVNQGGGQMWIGSDEHPTHTEYDSTNRQTHCAAGYTGAKPFDQCATGNSYTFTFTKAGSFDYHNHTQPTQNGSVTVVE
jgi:plastocyanin